MGPAIVGRNLSKSFRTYKKQPGFAGAVRGLFHRSYETSEAVKEVMFEIKPGGFVGFLGPNGAGKTTTRKVEATHGAESARSQVARCAGPCFTARTD